MTAPPPPPNPPMLNGDGHGVIVKQSIDFLYYDPGSESLRKVIDTHFDGYEWVLLETYDNTSSSKALNTEYTMYTHNIITSGSDVNGYWDFLSEVNNLQIQYDDTTKTFTDDETKFLNGYGINISVPEYSQISLYQKRYKFTANVWFVLDAWGQDWTVGNWKSGGAAVKTGTYYVDSNEHLTHGASLYGTEELSVTPAPISWTQINIKEFQDCTKKCQDYLHSHGV